MDLDQLETPNQRLCFFANVMNLLLAHASLHHIYQQLVSKVRVLAYSQMGPPGMANKTP